MGSGASSAQVLHVLRVSPDTADPAAWDPRATPVGPRSKAAARGCRSAVARRLGRLQEALYAEGVRGGRRSLLLVLQGMDTAGKGGTVRHVAGLLNPLGLRIASFGRPTEEELGHHFLWRIRRELPPPGRIGVFDRSHYEDVLVARVEGLVPEHVWRARFDEINDFESELADQGVTLVKCFLHVSPEEQRERLLARLDRPTKRWKYHPDDLAVRARWDDYQRAYADVLLRCSTPAAPWYVVPSDRKWYRDWVVARLLLATLERMAPRFPEPDFDVAEERARLLSADPWRGGRPSTEDNGPAGGG
ncbi:polyphosphate:nucleotide phosphotransferase, PPK2 family [Streptoalloteichus tenebrarius]|uniref:Polyphosphate:nucleotide phosphotransferase, PPK2 family n=1 Tax=Streptoalloteichus tenebrarius (strain ATCC 17920 / DSM 40477 / JCM 4838 / CBS 697.72 / NBRC 16177 / NCIMB 11028 / NRRL B-12390 / A12253. 1 / ISP 5477) TaxID=1933 RepID=A0ABT1HS47_STRSD|nr:PPK2 family polyphosphate kinase [Streptoalloteichus tenebrarius]MCP2258339.1 polyphosphate:nucleotide phosphotransferase, PPK2 family [Streptoalloteichus tenebrarius]BFF03505.1 polyphosphate--nucleotide phosphotransferase [Streptoalloteichus tenebrarius]